MNRKMILGLILCAAVVISCGTGGNKMPEMYASSESEGIYGCRVGEFQVYMLVEGQRHGDAGILVGVDEAVLQQYVPEDGFMHSTNAFLVKTPTQNILVDTAFGGDIFAKAKKLGVELDQIDAVLITHLHGDHFSGLVKDGAAAMPKAKVYLSAKEREFFTETNVNDGAVAALAPYTVETFEPGDLNAALSPIIPGISPIANYGHTPGHTVYLVENGKDKLIIAGDYLHVGLVQFARPDISASYDMDKEEAAASRKQILAYAAQNKIPIGGMHVVYPGVGMVEADGEGFRFIPAK